MIVLAMMIILALSSAFIRRSVLAAVAATAFGFVLLATMLERQKTAPHNARAALPTATCGSIYFNPRGEG
jgi:hypothetical protein